MNLIVIIAVSAATGVGVTLLQYGPVVGFAGCRRSAKAIDRAGRVSGDGLVQGMNQP